MCKVGEKSLFQVYSHELASTLESSGGLRYSCGAGRRRRSAVDSASHRPLMVDWRGEPACELDLKLYKPAMEEENKP